MYHWHNFIQIEPHSEDAYLYEEKDLRLINLKAFVGGGKELGFHPHAVEPPFFLDLLFEHQFNLSSRTLSETIVQMGFANVRSGNIAGSSNHR